MEKSFADIWRKLAGVLLLCVLPALAVRADTFNLIGGQTVTGEVVSVSDKGFVLKLADNTYSDPIPWAKLTQDDLKKFLQDPKAVQHVEPFIEIPREERIRKTEVSTNEVPRLPRPAVTSLFGAMGSSGLGLVVLLVLYGANLYAAYEISIFRSRPPGLVCGVAAVAPVLGPILFLALPTRVRQEQEEWEPPTGADADEPFADEKPDPVQHGPGYTPATVRAPGRPPTVALPPTRSFTRGQYTFNRRFFETQMPGFFAVVRPEADKDLLLIFKSARGTFVAQRISRISQTEIYIQVQKGHTSEDTIIPFVEIQEVQLKHRDA